MGPQLLDAFPGDFYHDGLQMISGVISDDTVVSDGDVDDDICGDENEVDCDYDCDGCNDDDDDDGDGDYG